MLPFDVVPNPVITADSEEDELAWATWELSRGANWALDREHFR